MKRYAKIVRRGVYKKSCFSVLKTAISIGIAVFVPLLKFASKKSSELLVRLFKTAKKNKRETLLAIAIIAMLVWIFPTNIKESEYAKRSPAEISYIGKLRLKYSSPSRRLSINQLLDTVHTACVFISEKGGVMSADSQGLKALLAGTAVVESSLMPRFQKSGGDAVGLFQIEYGTYRDFRDRLLPEKYPKLDSAISASFADSASTKIEFEKLQTDDVLCAIFAALKYLQSGRPIPDADDLNAQARIYKEIYNTEFGSASESGYIEKVGGLLSNQTSSERF